MYHLIDKRIREALAKFIREKYGVDANVVTERPPRIAMGEVASPVCFELAKKLKRAPRQTAQEIAAEIGAIEGVARWEVAGGGYLNAYLDRGAFFAATLAEASAEQQEILAAGGAAPKYVVEHTAINPNKAAHIGHVRNAVLGDTLVRLLRDTSHLVEIQNYIDNTGVQVADVVVGLMHLEKKSVADTREMAAQPRFDYYCWDLYARVTQWFEQDKSRQALRIETLKQIEHGEGVAAEIGEVVSSAIVQCHLRTMLRMEVEYDVLLRESDILHLKFWDAAFERLKSSGAIQFVTEGKNKGCWVMQMGDAVAAGEEAAEDDAKIIVRSNGIVTYVGKDIAYHLWKFGLLDREFGYVKVFEYPGGHIAWTSTSMQGATDAPEFGRAAHVFNVIDTRQSYVQDVVAEGLRALGHPEQSKNLVHFSYEMVALTPRCAGELGYELNAEEAARPWVDVSGRKGRGVKADDLIDRLEASARSEVDARHPEMPEAERAGIAHAIAIGALRFYLLKYTRNTIIAFDFKDALSFEGETGPYVQYAVVRIRNIFRKLWAQQAPAGYTPADVSTTPWLSDAPPDAGPYLAAADDIWELLLLAGSLSAYIDKGLGAQEPSFVARYAFQLAQAFNLFYQKHHILSEEDAAKKAFLLHLSALIERQLVAALELLGISAPERM